MRLLDSLEEFASAIPTTGYLTVRLERIELRSPTRLNRNLLSNTSEWKPGILLLAMSALEHPLFTSQTRRETSSVGIEWAMF
jgi:hypothetical protein